MSYPQTVTPPSTAGSFWPLLKDGACICDYDPRRKWNNGEVIATRIKCIVEKVTYWYNVTSKYKPSPLNSLANQVYRYKFRLRGIHSVSLVISEVDHNSLLSLILSSLVILASLTAPLKCQEINLLSASSNLKTPTHFLHNPF